MKRLRKAWWLREVHAHKRVQAWRKRYDGAKARRKHYDDLIAHHQPFRPLFGIDWAWAAPDISKLHEHDVHFACRYLSHDPSKNLDHAEAVRLAKEGIDSVVVWETTAGRALAGRAAGQTDAVTAAGQAKDCGAPTDAVIYFAVDFDMQASQRDAVEAYFRGVNSAIGVKRTGAYGGLAAIKALFDAKLISKGWQTYAWSGTPTQWDRRAHIHQYENGKQLAGGTVDFDRAVKPDYGGWRPR
jgi:Domain of unknown function (DUF1906)